MKKTRFLFTACVSLAIALIFSCSSDDKGSEEAGELSSSSVNGDVNSSPSGALSSSSGGGASSPSVSSSSSQLACSLASAGTVGTVGTEIPISAFTVTCEGTALQASSLSGSNTTWTSRIPTTAGNFEITVGRTDAASTCAGQTATCAIEVNVASSSSGGGGGPCTPSGTTFSGVAFKGSLQMDIKLPSGSGPWPVIMSSYGSAFGAGSRTVESPFNGGPTRSSGQKYATAAISYTAYGTNSPSYPKAVEDVLAAVRFLKANASTYCIDPDKVIAVGFSSGGYMTTMIAALSGVSGHKFDVGDNLDVSSKVRAAVSYAGISDIPNLENDKAGTSSTLSHCSGSPEAGFLGCNPCESSCLSKAQEASPITYITSGNCANLPPIIMTHGDSDALLSWKQSEKMISKIKEVCPNNTAIFNKVAGGSHQGGIGESNLSGLGVSGGYFGFLDSVLGVP